MATNVRLKDAAGNVLHPETDWSVVQNKPSIETSGSTQTWNNYSNGDTNRTLKIKTFNFLAEVFSFDINAYVISVADQATNNKKVNLADYPMNYNKLANKPSYFPTSWSNVSEKPGIGGGSIFLFNYPNGSSSLYTILIAVTQGATSGASTTAYYLNYSGAWSAAPSNWKNYATKLF